MIDFFSQEENFNVLFFGSSHVMNGIFPMQLWNDYGIVSYNRGNAGERVVATYYSMLLALKETTPKLIVIDAYMLYNNDKYNPKYMTYLHNTFDAYPISYMKYLAMKDIFDGENLLENEIEFLFNFSIYHARWSELEKKDFIEVNKYEKGASSGIGIAEPEKVNDIENIEAYEGEETINMIYLRKIIEYCQSNDIEILVINLPNQSSEEQIASSKYCETICAEYDINYINFLEMDIINIETDYYDSENYNSHLNPSGARKVTDYLGQYIMENYDIQDQRENEAYSFWYEDYDEYMDYKINQLENNKNSLNNYLMLLYGYEDIEYEIKISSTREIEEGSTLQQLLENIGNNYTIDDEAFAEKTDKTIKITTYDNRTGEKIQTVWF